MEVQVVIRRAWLRSSIVTRRREVEMMETTVLNVSGMSCGACVRHVTRALEGIRGVNYVDVSLKESRAIVEYNQTEIDIHALRSAIRDAGYDALPSSASCCCSGSSHVAVCHTNA
jgi:copper chaperone